MEADNLVGQVHLKRLVDKRSSKHAYISLRGQFHSISTSGMMLFQQGAFNFGMGGVVLDLASAPIDPGEYTLEINSAMGGVEIYLPRYVQFTIDGTSVFGGTNMHEGLG